MSTKPLLIRFLIVFVALLTGCLGSSEPYRPRKGERRPKERVETAEARAERLAVPVEIQREDAYLTHSKQEIARILGSSPKNSWNQYEWDLENALGKPIASKILGRSPVSRKKPGPAVKKKPEKKKTGDDDDDDDDDKSGDDDDDDSGDDDDDDE